MENLQRSPFPAGVLLLNEHLREGGCAAACVCHHRLGHRQHGLHCGVGKSCFCSAGEGAVQGVRTEWQPVVGTRLHVSKLGRLITHSADTGAQAGGKASVLPRSQPVCISSLISSTFQPSTIGLRRHIPSLSPYKAPSMRVLPCI